MEAQLALQTPSRYFMALCLCASLVLNLWIANAVGFESPPLAREATQLRINLMSLAAPAQPVKTVAQQEPAKTATPLKNVAPVIKKHNIAIAPTPQELAKLEPAAGKKTEAIKQQKVPTQLASRTPIRNTGKQKTNVIPLITDANYRRSVPPTYPRRAVEMGQQGTVLLHALINETGNTQRIKLAQSSGHGLLDKAALAAVKKWEFEPTTQGGRSIQSWVQVPVEFVLQH